LTGRTGPDAGAAGSGRPSITTSVAFFSPHAAARTTSSFIGVSLSTCEPVLAGASDQASRLALSTHVAEVFRQHKARQRDEREAAGERCQDTGLVFTTRVGTAIEPRNMNRHLDRLCELATVSRIRFHDLRHSCASLLYDQGVSIENIQDVLGHSSPTVTKTIYVEATRKVQREAVDRLGFLFDD
jgi:site-specific recombinase XerD